MKKKPRHGQSQNESRRGLKNVRGPIVAARAQNPHSATSQFFINIVKNSYLDPPKSDGWGYTVFGKVIKGMDVVDAIAKVPTSAKGKMRNVPKETIVIKSITRLP